MHFEACNWETTTLSAIVGRETQTCASVAANLNVRHPYRSCSNSSICISPRSLLSVQNGGMGILFERDVDKCRKGSLFRRLLSCAPSQSCAGALAARHPALPATWHTPEDIDVRVNLGRVSLATEVPSHESDKRTWNDFRLWLSCIP
jgi:hypothetical protein